MGSLLYRASLSRSFGLALCSRSILQPANNYRYHRRFHSSPVPWGIRSQVLKDVGEGITEVQIIQWYVEEGARIEEWKPLCQYQSDKAIDDITSRYEGVIKKLHFQPDDTAPTGTALCDIEVDDAKYPEANRPSPAKAVSPDIIAESTSSEFSGPDLQAGSNQAPEQVVRVVPNASDTEPAVPAATQRSKYASLATPAVRSLLKEHSIDILNVTGTGKSGRVMKEDVQKYIANRDSPPTPAANPSGMVISAANSSIDSPQRETLQLLTPIQSQMFKTMTKSLTIPHFLFADELNIARLAVVRANLNSKPTELNQLKLSFLPFIIKAVSLALNQFPLLNSRVDSTTNPTKPSLVMRSNHNIGVAMDTPTGLLVPNIKNVQARSILDIAIELARLGEVAKSGKLTAADLSGGTITVSNIGSIGGTYVSPVIVPTEVAILGVGKARKTPVYDEDGNIIEGQLMNCSWSADHRVVDGATMARMAAKVHAYLENPESMMLALR
ncbi:hypothetical protein FQN57_002919 [Myotisia sp. PD_48]|nr:hypothetical protein FQN57_002919 [Myotisia sp. PD_48]